MPEKINPYIAGAPVVESRMFFGREDVFSWIERSLSGQFVNHILVLHGQRRVGKTSVLKHLANRLPKSFIPIFIDLQGRVNTTLPRFLWWLAREITRALDLPDPQRDLFESDPELFESGFLPQVESQLGERVLLLTFDEFDTLESTAAQEGLALPFMAMLKHLMEHDKLNFIFSIGSSGRKLENMQAAYTGFFKQALYRKISFLGESDARDLVTRPVEGILGFDLDAVDAIHEITSGHPYFIQLICHELFSVCQKTDRWQVCKGDVEAVLDAVIERGTVNLKFVWDEASELEKWVLAGLAQFEKGASLEELDKFLKKHKVRFIRQDLESAVLHLREKDVLSSGNRFVIYLMKLWLVQNRTIEQVREELEKVNPIVSRLLQVGHEYLEQGEHQKAIETFQEALQAEEDNYEVRMGLAAACLAREDFGRASAEYEEILTLYPEDVAAQSGCCDAYLALGDFRLAMGRLDEAEYAFQQVLRISPRHTEGSRRMARLCHHRAVLSIAGAQEAALQQVHMALEYTPKDADLQASVQDLEALAAGQKDIQQVLGDWGQRASRSRNWQDAAQLLEAYQRVVGRDQPDESLLSALAQVRQEARQEQLDSLRKQAERMQRLEEYDEAIYALEKYLELQPEDAEQVPARIKALKEARKQAQLRERRAEAKPLWQRPLLWAGAALAVVLVILLAIPNSPLRPQVAAGPTLTPQTIIEERVVVATPEPTTAPTPTSEPLPYKWTRVTSAQFLERDYISAIAIDPNDADTIYVGTKNSGIYKSNDGGISWLAANNGLTSVYIIQIVIDPNDSSNIWVNTGNHGLYKSNDGARTWRWLDTQSVEPKSPDSSFLWDPRGTDHFGIPIEYSHLVYVNGSSISESFDYGESWRQLDIPFENPALVALSPAGEHIIAVDGIENQPGSSINIYISNEDRSEWTLTYEFIALDGFDLKNMQRSKHGEQLMLDADPYVLGSPDWGFTWNRRYPPGVFILSETTETLTEKTCVFYKIFGVRIACARYGNGFEYVKKSSPVTTSTINLNLTEIAAARTDYRRIVVGGEGIFITDDKGESWYSRVNGIGAVRTLIGFDPDQPLIYFGQHITRNTSAENTDAIQLFYSYNYENQDFKDIVQAPCGSYPTQPWEAALCPENEENYYDYSLYINQSLLNAILQGFNDYSKTNGFETNMNAITVDPNDQEMIYIGTDAGAFLSSDGGLTWGEINEGLMNTQIIYSMAINPNNNDLYAMTPYGIFKLEKQ